MTARRSAAAPRPPREPREHDAMVGPKRAVVAIAVFFAGSLLAVHLATDLGTPPAPALAATDAADAVGTIPAPAPSRRGAETPAPASAPAVDAVEASLGVFAVPPPARSASDPRERVVNACVEKSLREKGGDAVVGETAPGRWPGVKRAREELRRRRVALRSECERSVAL